MKCYVGTGKPNETLECLPRYNACVNTSVPGNDPSYACGSMEPLGCQILKDTDTTICGCTSDLCNGVSTINISKMCVITTTLLIVLIITHFGPLVTGPGLK